MSAAIGAGIDPASARAAEVVAEVVDGYARAFAASDSREYRAKLLMRLEVANDPRVEPYWYLIAAVNSWPPPPPLARVFGWFIEALRTHSWP